MGELIEHEGKTYEVEFTPATEPESGAIHVFFVAGNPEKFGEVNVYGDGRPTDYWPAKYEKLLRELMKKTKRR